MARTHGEVQLNGKKSFSATPLVIAMYAMIFFYAVSNTFIGPLVIVFMKQYEISLSANGLVSLSQGLGGILFLVIGIFYGDRLYKSTWIIITFGLYTVSLFFLAFASSYFQMLILFFFVGASTRLLDAIVNAQIAEIYQEKRAFFLSILHACFGLGALVGPLLSSLFVNANVQITFMFMGLGLLCALILALYLYIKKHTAISMTKAESKSIDAVIKLVKNPEILIMSLMAFLYVGYSLGMSAWFPTYMLQEMRSSVLFAGFMVSIFWVGVIAGRITHSFLSLRFKKRSLLIFGNILGGAAIVTATLINTPIAYAFGLFISAFFISAVMPLIIAMAGELFPKQTGSASSVIILGGALGLMVVPWVIGFVAETINFWVAVLVLAFFSFAMSSLAFLLRKEVAEEDADPLI